MTTTTRIPEFPRPLHESMSGALTDAVKACKEDGAIAVLTLRGGSQVTGALYDLAGHVINLRAHGHGLGHGWATVEKADVAAVRVLYPEPTS